jgi:hypothetical protein
MSSLRNPLALPPVVLSVLVCLISECSKQENAGPGLVRPASKTQGQEEIAAALRE